MTKLKITNTYSYLQTDEEYIKNILWKVLRFREKNYFHSRLYKQKLWDGFIDFFKKETGKFLTGLLPEVEAVLKLKNIKYEIIDERKQFEFTIEKVHKDLIKGKELRDYQIELVEKIIKHRRGIIHAPTSAGKTLVFATVLKTLPPNTPVLILANKKTLLNQTYNTLTSLGFDIGRLYDKYKDPKMITCATVQSIHKISKLLPKIKVLIVDEIHEMMSKTPKKVYSKLESCSVRIALSATPFKYSGTEKVQKYGVKGYFGPVLKIQSAEEGILTTKELQKREILSASDCTFYNINEPMLDYEIYADAVTKGIAESFYFHNVIKRLASKLTGRTLILVDRLAHGDTLNGLIENSLWVRGQDNLETREFVIKELQKSENRIAIATQQIFNAGIDVFVHNLINAAGGQADHQIIQRMGRGLRTADDKVILNYYDFIFKINEYLLTHSNKRVKILKKEGHNVTVKDIDF